MIALPPNNEFTRAIILVFAIYIVHLIYFIQKIGPKISYMSFISITTAGCLTQTYHSQYHVTWEHDLQKLLTTTLIILLVLLCIKPIFLYPNS